MHFCVLATRFHGGVCVPRKYGLNWFIPALVNSSVGSSCGTSGELGTIRWPWRSKYLRNERRISLAVIAGSGARSAPKRYWADQARALRDVKGRALDRSVF